jgi:cytochrome c-type biogenesis protein CcmH/NrfF
MDIAGLVLWGIALLVTIFLGVKGVQAVRRKRHSQKQVTKAHSNAIQSGRDTRIER